VFPRVAVDDARRFRVDGQTQIVLHLSALRLVLGAVVPEGHTRRLQLLLPVVELTFVHEDRPSGGLVVEIGGHVVCGSLAQNEVAGLEVDRKVFGLVFGLLDVVFLLLVVDLRGRSLVGLVAA